MGTDIHNDTYINQAEGFNTIQKNLLDLNKEKNNYATAGSEK